MIHEGREGVAAAEALLKEAGFTVSQMCCSRSSCFDYAARKNGSLIFVKIQSDIGNLAHADLAELKGISDSLSGISFLISAKARDKLLEDDTVYSRYSVSALTLKTFENMMMRGAYPLIQAGRGGYYVEIDGAAIRRRRQELGLSVGAVAKMIAVSRRTLYGYEHGMAKASVSAAYNMISTLGIPVAKPMNVFEKPRNQHKCSFLLTARRMIEKNKLLMRIFRKSQRCNVTTVKKAPFDFVITVPDEKMRVIGGVADNRERDLDKRVDEILSVSRIVQARPIMITEGQKLVKRDVSCICSADLSNIRDAEDLINIT
jgi:putative transcriptional regulator